MILVTGGHGFLGRAIRRRMPSSVSSPYSAVCDLRIEENCRKVVDGCRTVIHTAGNAGGIGWNTSHPGNILHDNVLLNTNIMHAAWSAGVEKFVQIGSVCSYPETPPRIPFVEDDLWNGYPEPTNGPYGISKRMALEMGRAYRKEFGFNSIHLLMANLYGPEDDFTNNSSHVVAALIRKFIEARDNGEPTVTLWGTGTPTREFLFVDDAAEAVALAVDGYDGAEPVNVGTGQEVSIKHLAELIREITGYEGYMVFDPTKPDGQPRRCLNVSRARERFGFTASTSLEEGLEKTVAWYERQGVRSA